MHYLLSYLQPLASLTYNASGMIESRIRELLQPFLGSASLSAGQLAKVAIHLELLLKWNAKINLTAVRDPEEIVTRHFGESFFAARQLFPDPAGKGMAIDLGSGAGFPGLPLKVWAPAIELMLIESNGKKAVFLRELVRSLDLTHVSVLAQRAEIVRVAADLVTLRAVEQFENAVRIASRFVKARGRLALLIGSAQVELAHSTAGRFDWQEPLPIPLSRHRVLFIGRSRAHD